MMKNIEQRDAWVNIRLTKKEKELVQQNAELAGEAVSEFGRRRLLGRPIIANVDIVMINELRRVGGLLKYAIKQSDGKYKQEVGEAILAVKNFIEQLSDIQKN